MHHSHRAGVMPYVQILANIEAGNLDAVRGEDGQHMSAVAFGVMDRLRDRDDRRRALAGLGSCYPSVKVVIVAQDPPGDDSALSATADTQPAIGNFGRICSSARRISSTSPCKPTVRCGTTSANCPPNGGKSGKAAKTRSVRSRKGAGSSGPSQSTVVPNQHVRSSRRSNGFTAAKTLARRSRSSGPTRLAGMNGASIVTCAGMPRLAFGSSAARYRPTTGSAAGTSTISALSGSRASIPRV